MIFIVTIVVFNWTHSCINPGFVSHLRRVSSVDNLVTTPKEHRVTAPAMCLCYVCYSLKLVAYQQVVYQKLGLIQFHKDFRRQKVKDVV